MRRRRRRRQQFDMHEEVELNMAAMLDMAFQLLAFFILTFKPSEVEDQISMRMPKEKAVTQSAAASMEIERDQDSDTFGFPLEIQLVADEEGRIARVQVGGSEFLGPDSPEFYSAISKSIGSIVGMSGCDGIRISVSESLKYEFLMQVVDVCARQKLPSGETMTKISISALK